MIDEGCIFVDEFLWYYLDMIVYGFEENFIKLEFRGKVFFIIIKVDFLNVKFLKNLNFICVDKDSEVGFNLILGWFKMKCNKLLFLS